MTIGAVGDIMMDDGMQRLAALLADPLAGDPDDRIVSGFTRLFERVQPDLDRADLLLGNLETPIAEDLVPQFYAGPNDRTYAHEVEVEEGVLYDGNAYDGCFLMLLVPNFNAHPLLARALREAGWDAASTANNHALDRALNGIDRTIDALRAGGLPFAGTYRSNEIVDLDGDDYPDNSPYISLEVEGMRVAFVAFTKPLNGVSPELGGPDLDRQVVRVEDDPERALQSVARARNESGADLVIVSTHWGVENTATVSPFQRELAQALADAGADVVLGHHPHVLQPAQKLVATDGRETVVFYSLGNITGGPGDLVPGVEATAIFYIGVKRSAEGTFLSGFQYVPVQIARETYSETEEIIRPRAIDRDGGSPATRDRIIQVLGTGNLKPSDAPIDFPDDCTG
ncbi:MAG: CapA family protein [bacterium]